MGLRDFLATTLGGVLERGRERSTRPRVLGIPVAAIPGQSRQPGVTSLPERATGCAVCGRTPRPDENVTDEWCVGADAAGDLHVLCPECFQRSPADAG